MFAPVLHGFLRFLASIVISSPLVAAGKELCQCNKRLKHVNFKAVYKV